MREGEKVLSDFKQSIHVRRAREQVREVLVNAKDSTNKQTNKTKRSSIVLSHGAMEENQKANLGIPRIS